MSTKGMKHTEITKRKISLANSTHTAQEFIEAWDRYEDILLNDTKRLPTIGGFCLEVGISQNNILEYSSKFPEVAEIISKIVELQQEFCLTKGITQQVNPIFSMFLLKSKHGFRDNPQTLVQNNYTNISPDVLKDALALMGDKHDKGGS